MSLADFNPPHEANCDVVLRRPHPTITTGLFIDVHGRLKQFEVPFGRSFEILQFIFLLSMSVSDDSDQDDVDVEDFWVEYGGYFSR